MITSTCVFKEKQNVKCSDFSHVIRATGWFTSQCEKHAFPKGTANNPQWLKPQIC